MTGGHYRLSREQEITMRDPDGRSVLTLEDLRYSTLPDLFRITTDTDSDTIDVLFDVALPASLTGRDRPERNPEHRRRLGPRRASGPAPLTPMTVTTEPR